MARPAGNSRLYESAGLRLMAGALKPAGVLGIWSAQREDALAGRLAQAFLSLHTVTVPVVKGSPDVIYLAS